MASWKAKLFSYGGRLVLINSVLTNMVLYMLSFFHLPKGVLQRLDYFRSRFFWQSDNEKRNIAWLGGILYVGPKVKGDSESRILRSKTLHCSANGYTDYSLRMVFGRRSFVINTLGPKQSPRSTGNQVTLIFGVGL